MKAADCRVLLTGATGGIGQAAAVTLLQAGASVMVTGRSAGTLAALAERAGPRMPHARLAVQTADLDQPDDLQALATQAAGWGCNVVVHGAGVPAFGRLQALPPARMQQLVQTNLLAPMLLTQALLPHLLAQAHAQVVCIGSALGRIGLPGFAAYSATKFGLRGFAEALRRELAGTPVQVQYLGPRSTHTGFNDASVQAYNRATGTTMDTPDRVAAALLRLVESGQPERFVGFPEALAVRLNGLAGPWMDGAFDKHRRSLPPLAPAS